MILFINSQFIGSRQTHHKRVLHQIDLQEHQGELCIENQRERSSHQANNYGPEVKEICPRGNNKLLFIFPYLMINVYYSF